MNTNKKIFEFGIINSDDRSEKVYYYDVCATSEKQARYFLGQHLGAYLTEHYKNVKFLKKQYQCNVFIIAYKHLKYAEEEYVGEIKLV